MYHERNEKLLHRHPIIPSIGYFSALKAMSLSFRSAPAVDCLKLRVSYQELINDAAMISKALQELGVKKGDIISISLTNTYHAIATFCAGNSIGAVVTFLNPQSTIEQEISYLNTFESPVFVHMDKGQEYNDKISSSTKVKYIINLRPNDIESRDFNSQKNTGYHKYISFNELNSIASNRKKADICFVRGKDDALIGSVPNFV